MFGLLFAGAAQSSARAVVLLIAAEQLFAEVLSFGEAPLFDVAHGRVRRAIGGAREELSPLALRLDS
jgi:hypothetical protein